MATRGMATNHALVLDLLWTCPSSQNGGCQHVVSDDFIKNAFVLPWLAVCGTDLHGHRINNTLLCDTMEPSVAGHHTACVPARISQVSQIGPEQKFMENCLLRAGSKASTVSRFREKLSPANWVQGITAISQKIAHLGVMSAKLAKWVPQKWGPKCDRYISDSAIYTTAIYGAYTVLTNVALTLKKS